ncbi:CbtA family protein (plasmid) [Azospirillum sp. A26]|uniref:CbtA family protein n=1 Tax=Azospirillum sp. A26 TaxID=3160607 RepID=UPI00366EBA03
MIGSLLLRGMLVGILAGLLAFGFARVFGEPMVEQAIALEEQAAQKAGEPAEPELVSREVQASIGLLTGVVVYGVGIGGLFALVFAFAYGRIGSLSPRALAALLAAAAFVAIYLVPDLKYPANPPAVGVPETIGYRTGLYFFMMVFSIAALAFAVTFQRSLAVRLGGWNGGILAAVAFVAIVAVVSALLPDINEVPSEFPALLLWKFRVASLGIQFLMWTVIGLAFGALAERVLVGRTGGAAALRVRSA